MLKYGTNDFFSLPICFGSLSKMDKVTKMLFHFLTFSSAHYISHFWVVCLTHSVLWASLWGYQQNDCKKSFKTNQNKCLLLCSLLSETFQLIIQHFIVHLYPNFFLFWYNLLSNTKIFFTSFSYSSHLSSRHFTSLSRRNQNK